MAVDPSERRQHERIEIEMKTRMWLDEDVKGRQRVFEGFAVTENLAIAGTFLRSDYLLKVGSAVNLDMTTDEGEIIQTRGEIVHLQDNEAGGAGMGILFTEADAENRERLLRFFVSDRIREFYFDRFLIEFPHLKDILTLKDVALTINLWEDREGRLTAIGQPSSAPAPVKAKGRKR